MRLCTIYAQQEILLILSILHQRNFDIYYITMDSSTKKEEVTIEGALVKRIIGLIYNAYMDYKSARVLFNSNLLTSACVMANQALEKQLKAYIEGKGGKEDSSHDIVKLFNILNRTRPEITSKLNKEYFKTVNKVYQTRYYEKLPQGYHHEILKNKFLAELDYSYSILKTIITIKPKNNGGTSQYELDISNNNPTLLQNNYILQGVDKQTFLLQPEFAEEFLMYGNQALTIQTSLSHSVDNGKFSYSGASVINSSSVKVTDWNVEEFSTRPINL